MDVPVLGMTCAACVRRVERAVAAAPGVASASVNLALSTARFELTPGAPPEAAAGAIAAIRAAGYEVPADHDDMGDGAPGDGDHDAHTALEAGQAREQAALRRGAIVAVALTAPLMVLAMAMVGGTPGLLAQAALGTLVLAWPGARFFRLAAIALRHRQPDMNVLVALGAGSAWLWSTVTTVRWLAAPTPHHGVAHLPHVYFEAAAGIIAFLTVGKLLEARARAQVSSAVRALTALLPARAARLDGDLVVDVPASELRPGDVVIVRPGTRAPADGTVIDGSSTVDESLLTGEALPVAKEVGAPLWGGTLNHVGALTVRLARTGASTSMARIARAVEQAQQGKAGLARLADRVSAWFTPVVLGVAALTFGVWLALDPSSAGLEAATLRAVAVLVIACPCALGLATPAAVAVGTSRAAELGVLVRGGDVIERVAALDAVLLDKTGTLTTGKPRVTKIEARRGATPEEVLALAAAVDQRSEHPLAVAIVAEAEARGLARPGVREVVAVVGGGMRAVVEGQEVRVGSVAFAETETETEAETEAETETEAGSVVAVARGRRRLGRIHLADGAAPDAAAAVAALRALGLRPMMVTGDRLEAARPVALAVGLDPEREVHAGVRPQQKAALVAGERRGGRRVAMVGDGYNDAPALAAADVGIAMGAGADAAISAAEITILRGGIAAVPVAIRLARATLHTIRRNLALAFAYNVVAIPLAAGALAPLTDWRLSPMIASAAMSLSSVSVLLSSLHLRRWRP